MEETGWEAIPLHPRRPTAAWPSRSVELDWKDVWYRLDEGRGKIHLQGFEQRITRTTNNAQAIPQVVKLLEAMDSEERGYIEYTQFDRIYNNMLAENSRAVLMRVALDIEDQPPTLHEQQLFRIWMELVDFVHKKPSRKDFNWQKFVAPDYTRSRLLVYVFYQSALVHPSRLHDWLMTSKSADNLPNQVVIDLLEQCKGSFQAADENRDGFVEYKEFKRFIYTKSNQFRGSVALRQGALAMLPRSKRTVERRRYLDECSCCPPPLFMILISIAEIVTFIIYAVDMNLPIQGNGPCPTYSPLVFNPHRRYEGWRYVTYAFIHSGWVHLVNNLLVQIVLGVLLEMVHTWRVIIIYLAGVVGGCLAHTLYTPTYYLAGASGGVYAVEYAHIGNLVLNWAEMQQPWAQLLVILVIMGCDLGYAIWDYHTNPNTATGHMAHLGGAASGILVGVVILRNLEEIKWERCCWWFSLVTFLLLVAAGILLNAFLPIPEFFPEKDYSSIAQDRDDWMNMYH